VTPVAFAPKSDSEPEHDDYLEGRGAVVRFDFSLGTIGRRR
jgi:hypothetical protein